LIPPPIPAEAGVDSGLHLTLAGIFLVPYLIWVSFAAVLNFAIWRLNG
jgi:hypothetical protein